MMKKQITVSFSKLPDKLINFNIVYVYLYL